MTARLAGMRIMLVEDDSDTAEALCVFLKHAGAEVLQLSSALEAFLALYAFHPHVLLSDMSMPDMDGCELIRKIRASETGHALPAIMLSGHAEATSRATALRAGFNGYVVKPFNPVLLVDTIVEMTQWRTNDGPR
jgi:two-component system, OmpR family, response regulator